MYDVLKSVLRHFAVYGVGTVLNRVIGFLLIPVYTHYLTTTDYGTLELIELTTYITGMFLAAGISYSLLRFYYDAESDAQRRLVVSSAHMATLAVSIIVGGWLVLFAPGVSSLIFESQNYATLFRLSFMTLILSVASEVPMGYIRAQQKSMLFTAISISKLALALTLNIVFLVQFGWGIRGIILSALITQLAATAVVSTYTFWQTGFGLSRARIKEMMLYGLPMIPGAVSLYVLNFADRYLLPRFSSLSQLGIYSLGYKFGMVIGPLVTEPFMSIWAPKMFEIAKRPDAQKIYANMLTYFLLLVTFIGLGISVLIKDVLALMSAPEFHSAYKVVPIIVLSYIVWGASYHVRIGILLAKRTKHIAYIMGVGAVSNVLLNLLLIPRYGMWGAAWATLAAYVLVFVLTYIVSMRFLRVSYQFIRILKLLVVAAGLYFASVTINVEPVALRLALKATCALALPPALFLAGFYETEEKRKTLEIFSRVAKTLKAWLT
jgi:O-antigen/teichoic acid export membrane protein